MKKLSWTIMGAIGAMLAASTGAHAQQSDAMPATPPAPDNMAADGAGANLDYRLLQDQDLDYVSLMKARAAGLTEDEVATVAKISELAGVPFEDVFDAVMRGETFFKLADKYNLSLADVLDVTDEKAKIAAYEAAYRGTGWSGYRHIASEDTELNAMFARFAELNANFPAAVGPSTLTFQRAADASAAATTTEERATVVHMAAPPAPEAHTAVVTHTVTKVRTAAYHQVKTTAVHRRHRVVRRVRHRMLHRHHQVHHIPVYMHRGS